MNEYLFFFLLAMLSYLLFTICKFEFRGGNQYFENSLNSPRKRKQCIVFWILGDFCGKSTLKKRNLFFSRFYFKKRSFRIFSFNPIDMLVLACLDIGMQYERRVRTGFTNLVGPLRRRSRCAQFKLHHGFRRGEEPRRVPHLFHGHPSHPGRRIL